MPGSEPGAATGVVQAPRVQHVPDPDQQQLDAMKGHMPPRPMISGIVKRCDGDARDIERRPRKMKAAAAAAARTAKTESAKHSACWRASGR